MSDNERDTSRLPRWAQHYISKLEGDVAYWKLIATAGPENSDTFVRRGLGNNDTPLGTGVTIHFGGEGGIHARREDDGSVVVRTSWREMLVLPSASNSIRVREGSR